MDSIEIQARGLSTLSCELLRVPDGKRCAQKCANAVCMPLHCTAFDCDGEVARTP